MGKKNERKNQHYVPKCYLRNFANGENSIATFMHSKQKFVQFASLDSVVAEEYFYGKDLLIEKMFSKFEGMWAEAFKTLISNKDVSDKELFETIYHIIAFIAFQHSRTRRVYDTQFEFKQYLTQYTIQHSASQAAADQIIDQYFPADLNLMEAPVSAGFSNIDTFRDLSLLFIENDSSIPFITSDNPVVLYNPFLISHNYQGNYGLNAVGLCLFLPLSPKIGICLFDPKTYYSTNNDIVCTISSDISHELNKLSCRNAYKYTFFSQKHTKDYAESLNNAFVDTLESKTSTVQSNIGQVILLKGSSILDQYTLPFITMRKNCRRMHVPLYGPAPHRYIRKSTTK